MKKIILFSFVVAALALASCGNKSDANAEGSENDSTAVDPTEVIGDMKTMLDANNAEGFNEIVSTTQEKIESLMKEGKVEEAQAYASKLKEFIDENAETIKSVAGNDETVNSIINTISNIPESASESLKEIEGDVKDKIENAAEDAVEDVKQEIEGAVEDAKQKANEAVEDAKQKASDAVDNAVEDAKKKTNNAINDAASKLKGKFKH